jgi:hypothetical protein
MSGKSGHRFCEKRTCADALRSAAAESPGRCVSQCGGSEIRIIPAANPKCELQESGHHDRFPLSGIMR